jgi:hypothetical protein
MKGKQDEIAALPAGNVTDLTYIRRVLAECRPAWWEQVKAGKLTQIKQTVWEQPLVANVTPQTEGATLNGASMISDTLTGRFSLAIRRMDSRDPLSGSDVGVAIPTGRFVQGDAMSYHTWAMLGGVSALNKVGGTEKVNALKTADKTQFNRFLPFWEIVTGAYYGTPEARRLACVMGIASFETANDRRQDVASRRPFGAMVLLELRVHRYPSVRGVGIAGRLEDMDNGEALNANLSVGPFSLLHLTLAEDRTLRDAIKAFAQANSDWKNDVITLPLDVKIAFDKAKDAEFARQRIIGYTGRLKNP